jgi:FtsH-binding integral membrane protein
LKTILVPCITWDDSLPDAASNPAPQRKLRGWRLVAAGLLLLALVLVVVYTGRAAFSSPLAIVVLAAIGLAALLLQLRLRKDLSASVRAPFWLNVAGLLFALASVFADFLHLSPRHLTIAALGAVVCFGISGTIVLRALRQHRG